MAAQPKDFRCSRRSLGRCVVLQVLAAIGEGRLKGADAQPAVGAVLGAIGIGKQQAATTLAKLKRAKAAAH